MPFKLISGIILTVFVALVTGFNLGNNTDVWFFHTFEQLPVVGVILGSFIFGVIITIPFCMFADHKSKKSIEEKLLLKIRKQEEKEARELEKNKLKEKKSESKPVVKKEQPKVEPVKQLEEKKEKASSEDNNFPLLKK